MPYTTFSYRGTWTNPVTGASPSYNWRVAKQYIGPGDANNISGLTVTVKASGGDFTTIQDAINYFKGKTVSGTCYINIDPGTYDEQLVINNINLGGTLMIRGDTRLLAGLYYVNGVINYHTIENAGSGRFTITRGGTGNKVLTIAGSAANPDFDADGWAAGDTVLVYSGTTPNVVSEFTLTAVSNNTLTASIAWPDPDPGTSGAGYTIVLQPRVRLRKTTPNMHGVYILGQTTIYLSGLYIYHDTTAYCPIYIGSNAFVTYYGMLLRGGSYSIFVSEKSTFSIAGSVSRITMVDSALGVGLQSSATANLGSSALIKVNTSYGYFSGYVSMLWAQYSIAIKCPVGYYAYGGSLIYSQYAQQIGCVATHSPTVNTVGNANAYIVG